MNPLTIAHISDLHLSTEHKRANIKNTRRLLEFAIRRNVDHIVITGDIAANAERRDFEMARKIFQSYGLLDPLKLTLVIGNHDIYGGVQTAEDILTFPGRCKNTDYKEQVKEFRNVFHEAFERCIFPDAPKPFPFAKVVGDVVLVGLNSIARHSGVRNPLGSNGEVDKRQMQALEQILASGLLTGKRKIVLIHHHFSKMELQAQGAIHGVWGAIERQTMKLRGKKLLLDLFAKTNVDLVLHGHLHESRVYMRKGIRFLNAGGSVLGSIPGELSLNLVSIAGSKVDTTIHKLPGDIHSVHHMPLLPLKSVNPEHVAA